MRFHRLIALLLFFACMMTLLPSTASTANISPRGHKLLIYYGIPLGVNQVKDEEAAAEIFSQYDVIVFGEGLEEPTHNYHSSTKTIIEMIRERKPNIRIFGYVDLGITTVNHSIVTMKKKVEKWKVMGASGVFLDDAGHDYGVSRERMNEIVRYVHAKGMPAFVNAWDPDHVMGKAIHPTYNPKGLPSAIGSNDIYLMEDFLIPTDITTAKSPSAFRTSFRKKMESMLHYRKQIGFQVMSISEVDYSWSTDAVRKFFRMNEVTAAVFSLDAYGIAPVNYSASRASMDVVRSFPYIKNYFDYYSPHASYTVKYNNQDFAQGGFRIHSLKGEHYYHYPPELRY